MGRGHTIIMGFVIPMPPIPCDSHRQGDVQVEWGRKGLTIIMGFIIPMPPC